jgi:GNAT superfamily N-acetyltransferase
MVDLSEHLSLIDITQDRLEEAVEVLMSAFEHSPLMRWFFADNEACYLVRLRALIQRECRVQLARNWPLKGIVKDTRLVGVASIIPPETLHSPFPASLWATAAAFFSFIGTQATNRLAAYDQFSEEYRPDEPHFYLSTLGVRPEGQGMGYAQILLDAVHLLSQAHPTSTGVALCTGNPANLPLYQRCGYQLRGQATLDSLRVWCLFRPNSPRPLTR